jgi:hypothetical protein
MVAFVETIVLRNTGASGLEVFVRGTDNAVYHRWQSKDAPGGWAPWANLGGAVSSLIGAQNADGRLEIFGRGTNGELWHTWQDPKAPGGWRPWASLGNP